MKRLPLVLLMLIALLSTPGLSEENLLVGGEQAGPFRLGAPFATVQNRLGPSDHHQATTSDPGTIFHSYRTYKLGFLVNPESEIIGITVARTDWKTAQGLGPGSALMAFKEVYGDGLKRGSGQLAFPEAGLAITHDGSSVETVYVVKKELADPVKGDRLLVSGSRAGQIRLGTSSSQLKTLLGPAPKTEGAENNIWIYPERGLRLGFVNDRLHMVGVSSGDWVTPSGLKVGRPFSDMKREFGSNFTIRESSVFFETWGVGARLQGDQVVEILIFSPPKSRHDG